MTTATAKTETTKQKGLFSRLIPNAAISIHRDGKRTVLTFPASSEAPVDRFFGEEVLSHEKGAVRLDRFRQGAVPLLFNHNFDDPIGMVETGRLEDGRLMVDASPFATARAAEVMVMITGGLRNVSIAYRIYEVVEDVKTNRFTVTDWEPYEVSIVTVPADPTVGIGRGSEEYELRMIRSSAKDQPFNKEKRAMEMKETNPAAGIKEDNPPNDGNTNAEVNAERKEGRKTALDIEKERKRGIETLCKMNKLDDRYKEMWINQGISMERVADEILLILEERGKNNPQPASRIGLTARETDKFSIRKAILAIVDNNNWKNAGFELECSKSTAQRIGKSAEPNKIYVPFEVLERPVEFQRHQRDLTVADAGGGGYLVTTQNVGFIEMLRNRSVVFRMGARRLSGLNGNVTVPRQSASGTAYWLASESTGATESQQTFVQMALTPHNVAAYTEISRQLLLQSVPGAEGIVTDDLAQIVSIAADLACINGGGSEEPTGIIGTSGVGSGGGATDLDYEGVLDYQVDVASANVQPLAGGYVTTPAVAALVMTRSRFDNTDTPIWQGNLWDGTMAGFRSMSSMQVPTGGLLFGDWQEVVVAEWGVLEIEVNPYANFPAGIVGVRAIYSMDVGVRRPFAFSYNDTIT